MFPASNTVGYSASPRVTWGLIAVCVMAFAYQASLSAPETEAFLMSYALVPRRYLDSAWASQQGLAVMDPTPFLTSMFLHGGWLHIASNLWTLWVFGPALEERLGWPRYLGLYLAAGLAAGLLHVVFNLTSPVPALGASGAIAGVIAAYSRRFPYAWVNVLQPVFFVPLFFMMPALLFAGLWFASQVVQAVGGLAVPASGGGVAWWAHIGGFLAGWILLRRLAPAVRPAEEIDAATRSILWPWHTWWRWMTWWTSWWRPRR